MRSKALLTGALALLLITAQPPSTRAQQPQISAEAQVALRYFLQVDCEIDTHGQALDSLLKFKELIPSLVQLLQQGPDAETLRQNDRLLEEQWNSRDQYLKGNPSLGLTEQQVQLARQMTKDGYIKTGHEQLIRKYRQKAASGLAAFDSPEARKALQAAMNDPDESVRAVIKAARSGIREKKKAP